MEMTPVIKTIITNFFESRKDIFGEHSKFEAFDAENNGKWDGLNSEALFGRIVFVDDQGKRNISPPLVIKLMPKFKLSEFFVPCAFFNEIFFYTNILPIFCRHGPADTLFPKFYHSCLTFGVHSDAAIIFENLSPTYRAPLNKAYLDYSHLSLMVRKLGVFHAYSYQMKKIMPDRFRMLANAFTNTHFSVTGELPGLMRTAAERGVRMLAEDPLYCDKVAKIRKWIESADKYIDNMFTNDKNNPLAVICHGDFLRNNVLFRYDKNVPVDMKIIDLASCKHASPGIDLGLVLYMNTDQNLRNIYFDQLIDEYYSAMRGTFPKSNAIPDINEIKAELGNKAFYAFLISSHFQPFLLAFDNGMPSIRELLPENLSGESALDLFTKVGLIVGGLLAEESLSNILKDMINRNYI